MVVFHPVTSSHLLPLCAKWSIREESHHYVFVKKRRPPPALIIQSSVLKSNQMLYQVESLGLCERTCVSRRKEKGENFLCSLFGCKCRVPPRPRQAYFYYQCIQNEFLLRAAGLVSAVTLRKPSLVLLETTRTKTPQQQFRTSHHLVEYRRGERRLCVCRGPRWPRMETKTEKENDV